MLELSFDCVDVQPERYAASPTLLFGLRIFELTGEPIHAVALRCQIRIEPSRRLYSHAEQAQLYDLFGEPARWGETMHPIQFASVSHVVPGFTNHTDTTISVPCSYDLEVAAGKYFASLADGEIPLLLLFSGTVFARGETGFTAHQIPWHHEARYGLPVSVWREMIDALFPNEGWLRMRRETIDALRRYRGREAIATWDDTIERLLKEAGEDTR
jgi:hypothetical protein